MSGPEDSESPWYVLVVDDKEGVAEETAELLNRTLNADSPTQRILAVPEFSFDEALATLGRGGVDLLVLDVIQQGTTTPELEGERRGIDVFNQVRSTRFLPIVFLTALPNEVRDYENPPFVHVVSKQADDFNHELAQCISECLDSPFPRMSREVQNHFARVSRNFMIDFVEENWSDLSDSEGDIAHLLMRRLGVSFDNGGNLLEGKSEGTPTLSAKVPPIRYYIVPPPEEFRMGDVLRLRVEIGDGETAGNWYIIMTPSCDLANSKADSVILAECVGIGAFEEYQQWIQNTNNSARNNLKRLLRSNPTRGQQYRYYYLPKAWKLPDLIVDLQRISHIPHENLDDYEKIVSIDSPYAESLSHQFHSYLGRIGTPDLDFDLAIGRMH